ncbi:ligand-binding sensor domain-containing protein [Algoriphagus winogradskyi]|uniref:Ligand-binding sensor domain-containing protein n=1 Tax=Algoriphagus winogradskyi TaxID=237017 RepID=A0ABY1NBX9_9BACT|nr:two-component regulator propeller domain-containing protein [Algoriphagus winogradskyi]SMP05700.1 ligand-binding sensor domain-containing protein [Algoriphagus winogradskyi]
MKKVTIKYFYYILALCLLLKHPVLSQSVPSSSTKNPEIVHNYVMEIWNNSKGLPQNAVFAMEKDNFGYLWTATEEGLARFDGKILKVFDQDNYPEMLEQTYYNFFKTESGIWAAGDRSIALLNKNIKTIIDCSEITDKALIRAIADNGEGGLLIGNQKGQIFSWDQETFTLLPYWTPGVPLDIFGFYPLKNSIILVGTSRGIYELNLQTRKVKLVTRQDFSALKIFGNGDQLYVYALDEGIFRLKEGYILENIYSFKQVNIISPSSLIADSDNSIWAGSLESGLIKMSEGRITQIIYPELQTYTVRKIIREKDNLYLGTVGKGLAIVRPAKIKHLNQDVLQEKNIKPIYQAADSSIWIGTKSDGVYQLKNGEINSWKDEDGLLQNRVNTIGSANGKVYVGSLGGVSIIDQQNGQIVEYLTKENGLQSNYVYAIFRDSKNWLWILTRGGGIHYIDEKDSFHQVELPEKYANTSFISILELNNKQVIIGSVNEGFLRFENDQLIENQILPLPMSENLIYSMYEDRDGDLWFATHGGIVLLHQGEFKILKKENGLKSRGVFSIISDGNSGIWTTNNFGVQYFPNSELEKFKHTSDEDFHIVNNFYNESHGMPNSETNGLIFPSALKDYSGEIWIPTVEGIGIIRGPSLAEKEDSKNFLFMWDNLHVGGQIIGIENEITIPEGVRIFQVTFSLIDIESPDRYSFFYRINKNSEEWQPISDSRQLNFTGLKPGYYNLEIKVLRHGKTELIKSLPIRVKATWFESLVFKILLLIAFGVLVSFMVKYYYNVRMKRSLECKVNQRTAELSNTNDQLKKALSEIERKNNVLIAITWHQSHKVRAALTKAMGIAQVLSQYSSYPEIGLSKNELEIELQKSLEELDQIVRKTHSMSENMKNHES